MNFLTKKFPVLKSNPWLAAFFGTSLATFAIGLLAFTFVYLLPGAETARAERQNWAPTKGKSILAVHMANNGMVFLQGAEVLSVSGTTIVVGTSWNISALQWIIKTDESYYEKHHFGTSFLDSKGNQMAIKDIRVGDAVSVNGDLDVNSTGLILKADVIRI